jgi:hypothetical protein
MRSWEVFQYDYVTTSLLDQWYVFSCCYSRNYSLARYLHGNFALSLDS